MGVLRQTRRTDGVKNITMERNGKPGRQMNREIDMSGSVQNDICFGKHAVREALRAGKHVQKIYVAEGAHKHLGDILSDARQKKIPVTFIPHKKLSQLTGTTNHQSIAAQLSSVQPKNFSDLLDILPQKKDALYLALDHLEDVFNVGNIVRTADACGVDGIILPTRRAAPLNAFMVKASAGAAHHVPFYMTTNLVHAIDLLKENRVFVCGLDMSSENLFDFKFSFPLALVVGSEEKGLSRLVREHCDALVSIPMFGKVSSLNASTSCAVALYEAIRQKSKQT